MVGTPSAPHVPPKAVPQKAFWSRNGGEDEDEEAKINGGIVRKLDLVSLDPSAVEVLQLPEWWEAQKKLEPGAPADDTKEETVIGVKEVNEMIQHFADSGAKHLISAICRDPSLPTPGRPSFHHSLLRQPVAA